MQESQKLITLSALLITKFCHDMAGPLGGIQNGIEFLSEEPGDAEMAKQAASLLGLSSSEASARLQLFRQAYGTFSPLSPAGASEIAELIQQYLGQTKIALAWRLGGHAVNQQQRSALLQQITIAHQLLIYGGNIEVTTEKTGGALQLNIGGTAPKMNDDAEMKAILQNPKSTIPENPAPKLIHALYWREYAAANQLKFTASFETGHFQFATQFPAAA